MLIGAVRCQDTNSCQSRTLILRGSMEEILWRLPWRKIQFAAEISGVQNQLELEITDVHPLSGKAPVAIGRRVDCDDVLVKLKNGSYANVHLVWGSGPDALPEHYPVFTSYETIDELIAAMSQDSVDYGE